MSTKFFPPYLNCFDKYGTRSSGPAVVMLQLWLNLLKSSAYFSTTEGVGGGLGELHLSGEYDDTTQQHIIALQQKLGFSDGEQDGNFGPATRQAVKEQLRFNIEELTQDMFTGETKWANPKGKMNTWPPKE